MVSYRDDHDATFARLAAVEREAKQLEAENQRLTVELAKAREWLGGPRRRILLAAASAGLAVLVFGIGLVAGRALRSDDAAPVTAAPPAAPLPQVFGVMVADGPELGRWRLNATRCAVRQEGVELTATGSDGHSIWIGDGLVEIELPAGALRIEKKHCWDGYKHVLERVATTPSTFEGYLELDCGFGDNSLHGRIEFRSCR